MLRLDTPLAESRLPTLTARTLASLQKGLNLHTVRDLLWHLPLRYEERGAILPIGQVRSDNTVTVVGTVERTRSARTFRKKMALAEATVGDPTGTILAVWFRQPWMATRFRVGDRVLLTGKVAQGSGKPYLANPSYEILARNSTAGAVDLSPTLGAADSPFIPIYPETAGLTSRWLHYLITQALQRVGELSDEIPSAIRTRENLQPLATCLERVHTPHTRGESERARNELLLRELFLLQCTVLLTRLRRESHRAIAAPLNPELIKRFLEKLPYRITEGQRMASYEILRDMEKPRPMRRLLVGDVGSGKTVVAAIAALNAVKANGQVALMAPTEILTKQHFQTLVQMLAPMNIRIALLTGSESRVTTRYIRSEKAIAISKPKLFKEISAGTVQILIGTHALISRPKKTARPNRLKPNAPLRFKKLLLAIIDEQHRFGVAQRKRMEDAEHALSSSAEKTPPHLLTLTATPIPRTLALTIFGDLDISSLKELPRGRKSVTTTILTPRQEQKAFRKIREEVAAGHQAFVICPLISKSEKIEAKAAKEEYERLKRDVFPDLALGILHGALKSDEKEKVMKDFARGKIEILIATPVVEVGIDIPNATVIMIEGAERFGLAQLYQFRGRVGRSDLPSFCFLVPSRTSAITKKRLSEMAKAKSGSDIARADLAIRGPGEFLGDQQSGVPDTIMQAIGNLELVERARNLAKTFLQESGGRFDITLTRRLREIQNRLHLS